MVELCSTTKKNVNFIEIQYDFVFEPDFSAANTGTTTTCQSNEIMCVSDGRCIEAYKYCNGIVDCYDATDEENCPGQPGCSWAILFFALNPSKSFALPANGQSLFL